MDLSLAFVLAVLALVILGLARDKVSKEAETRELPSLSDSDPRNIRDARCVLRLWKSNRLEQLPNWTGVEGLVTRVCFACIVYDSDRHGRQDTGAFVPAKLIEDYSVSLQLGG